MKSQKFFSMKGLFLLSLVLLALAPRSGWAQIRPFNINQLAPKYREREANASPALKQLLAEQRKLIAEKQLNFHVANTQVSGLKLENITGIRPPTEDEKVQANQLVSRLVISKDLQEIINRFRLTCNSQSRSYDARNFNLVPGIHAQQCGNCWAYSSVGALEISYVKVAHVAPAPVALSEKQVVACAGAGTCGGGWPYKVFQWMTATHTRIMNASLDPDNGQDGPCIPVPASALVEGMGWGLVDASAGLFNIASIDKIKEAICTYGSVSCCLDATPLFQNFAGHGVFTEFASTTNNPAINHAIVLIGWDDARQAWLLRNSWGPWWGDSGYAWIGYHTNNIGYGAIWVVAKKPVFYMNKTKVVRPVQ